MTSKKCTKCGIVKPLDDFYNCRNKSLCQRTSSCKECYRLRNRTLRRRKYNQEWRKRNNYDNVGHGKTMKEVRIQVSKALKSGELVKKPCEVCGEVRVHAHHPNYFKPLEVMWLCQKHHSEWHRKNKAIAPEIDKPEKPIFKKQCRACGKDIDTIYKKKVYCSRACVCMASISRVGYNRKGVRQFLKKPIVEHLNQTTERRMG